MILCKLYILERAVDLLVIVVHNADAQKNYTRKIAVAPDLAHIAAEEHYLVLAHELRTRCEEHEVG